MTRLNTSDVDVVLSLGSNCGNRHENVSAGIKWLETKLSDFKVSHLYATPDCLGSQKEYINAVASGTTTLSPNEIDILCKQFELSFGRDAQARKSNMVPIDIDLVIYGDEILRPRDYACDFFQIGFKSLSPSSSPSSSSD